MKVDCILLLFNTEFFGLGTRDPNSLVEIIRKIRPDEVYNLAAQSHVGVSFQLPNYTSSVNSLGTLNLLQAIKDTGMSNKTKF